MPPRLFGADWFTWLPSWPGDPADHLLLRSCALALSRSCDLDPAVTASGLSVGARRGAPTKGGTALDALGKVGTVAFETTGTLTSGRPEITDVISPEATLHLRSERTNWLS
jgi:Cd2+/Zn2+-exporting ATPase